MALGWRHKYQYHVFYGAVGTCLSTRAWCHVYPVVVSLGHGVRSASLVGIMVSDGGLWPPVCVSNLRWL